MPPIYHKQLGRPKKSRKKGPDKTLNPNLQKLQRYHTNLSCGNYGQEGLTRVNCKEPVDPIKQAKYLKRQEAKKLAKQIARASLNEETSNGNATKGSQCQSQPIQNSSQIVEILQGQSQPAVSDSSAMHQVMAKENNQSGQANLNQVAGEQQTKKRLKSPVKRNKAPTWLQKQRATMEPWHY
ncbi:hypothetical protein ACFX13_023121 [Malus domestica]